MSIQQMLLGVGAVAKKTYIDDVFSTFVYAGTGANRSINNGIDMSSSGGGLTWIKKRTGSESNYLFDTERGAGKYLQSNGTNAEGTNNDYLSAFNNNGFSLGDYNDVNGSGQDYASWTFRKSPGFFDVVTYTGNGSSSQTVSHSLGCIPGMMIVKKKSGTGSWEVYHRRANNGVNPAGYRGRLDYDFGFSASHSSFDSVEPSATTFELGGASGALNSNGETYIAYLFAGGESNASEARSVDFDGNDYLTQSGSSDFEFGTGDFTWEAWINSSAWSTSSGNTIPLFSVSGSGGFWVGNHSNKFRVLAYDGGVQLETTTFPPIKQWTHVAVTRSGTSLKLFYNGNLIQQATNSHSFGSSTVVNIALDATNYNNHFTGSISNLRVVKGTAVYTSSFRPSTEPLTNITNTKLLCCNNSSTTGSTVTPGTITAGGNPTASTDSPFEDPAGFVFGENKDQNVVKCGSYVGTGSADLPVALGWGPQWIMVKKESGTGNWVIIDMMRSNSEPFRERIEANDSAAAFDATSPLPITHEPGFIPNTALGFKVRGTDSDVNTNGSTYIYMAIRQDSGLVKRPPSLGTEVFTMVSTSSNPKPSFVSGFPVNFALDAIPTSTEEKRFSSRTAGPTPIYTNKTNAGSSNNRYRAWDVMNGFGQDFSSYSSNYFSWMWRSYSGAVSQSYDGSGAVMEIPHLLGQTPEMMFIKGVEFGTGSTQSWVVYHKALGSSADLQLNQSYSYPSTDTTTFNSTAPTSTHVTVGTSNRTNFAGSSPPTIYRMMLFASVAGISKIDSFDGSNSDLTITVGFQPRFLMVKQYAVTSGSVSGDWVIVDTVRGWGSGNDKIVHLNTDSAISDADVGTPTSTGFTLTGNNNDWNQSGKSYIYYAHA